MRLLSHVLLGLLVALQASAAAIAKDVDLPVVPVRFYSLANLRRIESSNTQKRSSGRSLVKLSKKAPYSYINFVARLRRTLPRTLEEADTCTGTRAAPSSRPSLRPSSRPSARPSPSASARTRPIPGPSPSPSPSSSVAKRAISKRNALYTLRQLVENAAASTSWEVIEPSLLCPAYLTPCPMYVPLSIVSRLTYRFPRMGTYECLETDNDLESCGGCASRGEGKDCTAIKGAIRVRCYKGQCLVVACQPGLILVNGANGRKFCRK